MVKIGFICEGFTEFYLLNSKPFIDFLLAKNIHLVNVINAMGAGNLLPHNIAVHVSTLESQGAEKIIILTDLDKDACIAKTKERLNSRSQDIVVIAVKQIEAWFLAATSTMRKLLQDDLFEFEFPELEEVPFETIRRLKLQKTGSGISGTTGGKLKLLRIMQSLDFSIEESANHPNCTSAAYFLNKLSKIQSNNELAGDENNKTDKVDKP